MFSADPAIVYLLTLFLVGIAVGIGSGLFGIGGGFLMVPVQFWLLGGLGVDPVTSLRTAFGTSLAVVIPTAASGAWAHHCRRCVRWRAAALIGASAAVFSFLGAQLSIHVPARPLELLLGLVLCAAALRVATERGCERGIEERTVSPVAHLALGAPVGLLSGLLGIGGGIVVVPLLAVILRYPTRTAIGTSMPVILCAAVGGVIGYAIAVPAAATALPWSIGYVNLAGAFALAAGSVPAAQIGARWAHACPPHVLRLALAGVMLLFGILMLDVPRLLEL